MNNNMSVANNSNNNVSMNNNNVSISMNTNRSNKKDGKITNENEGDMNK